MEQVIERVSELNPLKLPYSTHCGSGAWNGSFSRQQCARHWSSSAILYRRPVEWLLVGLYARRAIELSLCQSSRSGCCHFVCSLCFTALCSLIESLYDSRSPQLPHSTTDDQLLHCECRAVPPRSQCAYMSRICSMCESSSISIATAISVYVSPACSVFSPLSLASSKKMQIRT